MYLYTCKRCAPEGLSVEEYATRPLAQVCFVCGEEARHWYTSAERVLKALLQERLRDRAERNRHDIQNRCVECAGYRRKGATTCGNCGLNFAETNQRDAREVVPVACPPELAEAAKGLFGPAPAESSDAERYRWLRANYVRAPKHRLEWYLPRDCPLNGDGLDQAIDEARRAREIKHG